MAEEAVPVYADLSQVYGGAGLPAATERFRKIKQAHNERFKCDPEVYTRAPGRVNIIGEHIDYEGYGVLPMALNQDTVVAISKSSNDAIVVTNLDRQRFPDVTFTTDPKQTVDVDHHTWANYFLAAYKGVYEYLESKGIERSPTGLEITLHGVVPTGSGLSSSAAFTCSASLAILSVLGVAATKGEVADFACRCERYVGTQSGGMDQAISMMGKPNVAQYIQFNPVRGTDVVLPESAVFVVANSLTVSNKAETAYGRYNLRVVECRLAAAVLAIALGQPKEAAVKLSTLREIEALVGQGGGEAMAAACDKLVRQHLHEGYYTKEELEPLLGVSLEALYSGDDNAARVLAHPAAAGGFRLRDRAAHVFAEAQRVLDFQAAAAEQAPESQKLARLGALMQDSQASCRDLFECSCEELDSLVEVSRAVGALGSRLTGAGWGGCTVSLVEHDQAAGFIAAVKERYYAGCIAAGKATPEELDSIIFASKPSSGGAILKLADI